MRKTSDKKKKWICRFFSCSLSCFFFLLGILSLPCFDNPFTCHWLSKMRESERDEAAISTTTTATEFSKCLCIYRSVYECAWERWAMFGGSEGATDQSHRMDYVRKSHLILRCTQTKLKVFRWSSHSHWIRAKVQTQHTHSGCMQIAQRQTRLHQFPSFDKFTLAFNRVEIPLQKKKSQKKLAKMILHSTFIFHSILKTNFIHFLCVCKSVWACQLFCWFIKNKIYFLFVVWI